MKSNKKKTAPTATPASTRTPRKFETVAINDLPSRAKTKDWTDIDAAFTAALADPDRAIVFFSGNPKEATYQRSIVFRRLQMLDRESEFNLSARLGKVYIWKA